MAFIGPNDNFKIKLAAWFAWLMLNLLGRTVRLREIGSEHFRKLENEGKGCVFTVWHGRMFIPIFVQRNRGIVAMVSQHTDGEIIAQAMEMLGYRTVRGSSTRGGGTALRDIVKLIKSGAYGAMTPDGPRGPKGDFKEGTLILAQLTGAYLVPMTHACSKAKVFGSWDSFMLAKPFSKVVVAYGEPVEIPRKLDADGLAKMKKEMEHRMNELIERAEQEVEQ